MILSTDAAGSSPPPQSPLLIKTYKDMIEQFDWLLLEALKEEIDPNNQQELLWTISAYIYETVPNNKILVQQFIGCLLRQIVSKSATAWKEPVILTSFRVLTDLASIYSKLYIDETNIVKNVEKDIPHELVTRLCKFFEISCNMQCAVSAPADILIVECIDCMKSWCLASNWILFDRPCFQLVLSVIDKTLGEQKADYFPPTEKIKEATSSLFTALLNQHGHSLSDSGPSNLSALPTESDLLESQKLNAKNISCFVFNNTLISVIRHNRGPHNKITDTLVLRDMTGKYVWNTTLNFTPAVGVNSNHSNTAHAVTSTTNNNNNTNNFNNVSTTITKYDTVETSKPDYLEELPKNLDQEILSRYNAAVKEVQARVKDETEWVAQNGGGSYPEQKRPNDPPLDLAYDTTPSRLLLSHLGFLSLDNKPNFLLLQNDVLKPFNFSQNFTKIDATNERETFSAGVVFIPKHSSSLSADQILALDSASSDFYDFISNLGWGVDLATHKGYTGTPPNFALDANLCSVAPYYSDLNLEIIFQVSTLIKDLSSRKKFLGSNKVLITWMDEFMSMDKLAGTEAQASVKYNIVISPLPRTGDLFLVKILKFESPKYVFGPIIDEMIVGKRVLPELVRMTAINMSKALTEDKGRPMTFRKFLISDFKNKHRVDAISLAKFYSSQFNLTDKTSS
eukprot:TRINITY_DN6479_c0_g1_i2.p1 TRINITY_DN6479_c0_g1~~TRINITY_DN6479_c0_g1_i2.p1  ORF type:complete len:680 (-),score=165.81 TRINITY_DN6479_c0_g1_i2:77-2116(-)